MPVPPPLPDPGHIETRLVVLAQMLENAVSQVYKVMDEIRSNEHDENTPRDSQE